LCLAQRQRALLPSAGATDFRVLELLRFFVKIRLIVGGMSVMCARSRFWYIGCCSSGRADGVETF